MDRDPETGETIIVVRDPETGEFTLNKITQLKAEKTK